jgi:hypothetical protein
VRRKFGWACSLDHNPWKFTQPYNQPADVKTIFGNRNGAGVELTSQGQANLDGSEIQGGGNGALKDGDDADPATVR